MERWRGKLSKLFRRTQGGTNPQPKEDNKDDSQYILWDLNDPEKAKESNLPPGYYVEIPNISPQQWEDPEVLYQFIVPINTYLAEAFPQDDQENIIPIKGHTGFRMDLNNFWRISVYGYNLENRHMLVAAERIKRNLPPKSNL